MYNKEYKSMQTAMQEILNKSWPELKETDTVAGDVQLTGGRPFIKKNPDLSDFEKETSDTLEESTAAYKKSLERIAKDRTLRGLSSSDRKTLKKIADLMNKEKQMELIRKEDVSEEVNEVKTNVFTLNDLDDNDAGVVIAMAKKAKVFLRSKKVSMTRQDVQLKGDKKKVFKLINSLPESVQIDEKLETGPIDPRTLAGKIITGEVKLLTVDQSSPGARQTYILATGKPSVMGAPPDSIYIDATGSRPRGSGLAIGFRLSEVKSSEIKRDGSARVELK